MVKKRRAVQKIAVVGAAISLAGLAVAADKVVKLSEVPDAVKATITEHAKGATPTEIELENEDGKQIYSVKFEADGKEREIEIAPDGKFIKEDIEEKEDDDDDKGSDHKDADDDDDDEKTVDAASLPDVVKKAFDSIVKGAEVEKYTSETEDGKMVYEAEYEVDKQECSVKAAADGTVLEIEKHVKPEALPAAVINAVKAKYADAKIVKAEEVTKNPGASEKKYYEVKILKDGKKHEVKLDAAGVMMKDKDEDDD